MRSRHASSLLGILTLAALAGCGGTPSPEPVGPFESEAGPGCDLVSFLPPVIRVGTENHGPQCDPTFTRVDADSSASKVEATRCGEGVDEGEGAGCPAGATRESCTFALFGLEEVSLEGGHATVRVSEPGFEPVVVHGVTSGLGGCTSRPTGASFNQVTLSFAR
jgi:hypothetical protein